MCTLPIRGRAVSLGNFLLLPACFAFCACAAESTAVHGQNTLGGRIEFSMSGGFAGIRQGLTVDDTGQTITNDEKRGLSIRGQLDAVRLAELRTAFKAIDVEDGTMTQRSGSRCADCFQYTIEATIGGRHHRAAMNSTSIHKSPYGDIVKILSQILREMLSSQ